MGHFQLPDLITLNSFNGDWDRYYEYIYECFCEDFLESPLETLMGKRIGLKRHPLTDDKESTFYHITHEGSDEQNREPDLRRMERIKWVKYIMSHINDPNLKVWKNVRGRNTNILIFHEIESYLVILSDRGEYVLPWTAYLVGHGKQKEKLLKEYETYKKAEAAK